MLWGTLLFDYETEEDAKSSLSPKLIVEILGVSEWDGKGRANNYPGGFLLVTHTGGTYYVSVTSLQERDEWILHLRKSLECVFANPEVAPFKPSKIIQQRPPPAGNQLCPKSQTTVSSYSPLCPSCGRAFYAAEHLSEASVLLQLGSEETEKICHDCKLSQMCILWLKIMNYIHTLDLHEHTPAVLKDISKYKSSFRLRRRISPRLDMAAQLYESGNITAEEFEELRAVDHGYRREMMYEECSKLQIAIEAFGEDMQTIINILMDDNITNKGGRNATLKIVLRLLELADRAPDLLDFYFPQLYQVHLQQSLKMNTEGLIKLDIIQQLLLVLSQKYPAFGLKLAWNLLSSIGDYQEKKIAQMQFAAAACLLLQLEMVISGVISSIADVPVCRLLNRILHPARHQQQEIGYELGALFLIRRKLQEAYDEDDNDRRERNLKMYGPDNAIHRNSMNSSIVEVVKQTTVPNFPGSNRDCSCIELFYSLGVGQNKPRRSLDDDEENDSKTEQQIHYWDGFSEQLDFIDRLNDLVESLRFIDRAARSDTFKKQLTKWNNAHKHSASRHNSERENSHHSRGSNNHRVAGSKERKSEDLNRNIMENPMLGWDPTVIAGEPQYRITRIIVEECRVFRTKARAPSLLVCEVMRDDLYCKYFYSHAEQLHVLEDAMKSQKLEDSKVNPNGKITEKKAGSSSTPLDSRKASKEAINSTLPPSDEVDDSFPPRSARKERLSFANANEAANRTPPPHRFVPMKTRGRSDSLIEDALNETADEKEVRDNMNSVVITSETLAGLQHQIQEKLAADSFSNNNTGEDNDKAPTKELMIAALGLEHSNSAGEGESSPNKNAKSPRLGTDSPTPSERAERRGSWQLPRWKTSSFLASNRLSASTQGILKSSQVTYPNVDSKSKHHAEHVNLDHLKTIIHNQGTNAKIQSLKASQSTGNLASQSSSSSSDLKRMITKADMDTSSSAKSVEGSGSSKSPSPQPSGKESGKMQFNNYLVPHQDLVVSSAQRLLQEGAISQKEYEQLLQSDRHYRDENARDEAFLAKHRVENALGETFQSKKERILGDKIDYHLRIEEEMRKEGGGIDGEREDDDVHYWPAFDLRAFIVKTNDDLRQEICCVQLMQICKEIFEHFGLSQMLFLKPYRIICTGYNTGIVEVLNDTISLDGLKKTPGFTTLLAYFKKTYNTSPERLLLAKYNFMSSLAAYSLFSYLLLIKDRHNGNLLIDSDGHILHIDFGFLLSIAPGGSFSVETAPFKLTEEMVELLGGLDSPLFGEFVTAFTRGFIALQANCENIISAIQVLSVNSTFPCFQGKAVQPILEKLKNRFRTELNVKDAVKHCLDLITNSYGHYGTRQYDTFQYYTNGILP